ncbi:MAG: hypothetical protein GYB31_17025 [Bacteroidetes bacterium]|nr:hypothetical protein [Bacteroidota bacterium]
MLVEGDSLPYPADNLFQGNLDLKYDQGDISILIGVSGFDGMEGTFDANFIEYSEDNLDYYGDTGTVIVEEIDNKKEFIRGTFTAEASLLGGSGEVQITEGEFQMKYYDF